MPAQPTIRSLARDLHLSPTTVSDALRGAGRVDAKTIRRVKQAAATAGYRPNPLTTALMSGLRRSRATTFRGVLAAIDISETEHYPHGPFPKQLVIGARKRAKELGFKFEEFVVGPLGLPMHRLDSILRSRSIHGLMILPAWRAPDLTQLSWANYAGIYTDNVIERPRLHNVCPDHYRSMIDLLDRLAARGYRRPGLMLETGRDDRVMHRQSAAFRAFQERVGMADPVPIHLAPSLDRKGFLTWFQRHRPDVVLSHYDDVIGWLREAGFEVPRDHGYVSLNVIYQTRPCAGLDLQPHALGARAVELLIGQLQRAEYGSPPWPTTTMLPATWVDGPSIRPLPNTDQPHPAAPLTRN